MDPPQEKSTAGAWAAAAVVLALGGLAFGVTAHLRAADLEAQLDQLEATRAAGTVAAPATSRPAELPASSTTTPGSSAADPGAEPPDPDDARRDIAAAFETLYDGSRPTSERLAAIDDAEGVGRALGQVESGEFAEAAAGVRVAVDNVSFTSDTRAIVSYTLSFLGLADQAPRRGEARVVGGRWVVTRATVCTDLGSLGASCA